MQTFKRVSLFATLSLIPMSAFAAATGADGGFFASLCATICGSGCCG